MGIVVLVLWMFTAGAGSGLDGSFAGTYKEVVPAGKRQVDRRTGNHAGPGFARGDRPIWPPLERG